MEDLPKKFLNYLISQTDKMTAWIGGIGLVLQLLNLQSAMFLLFTLLIVLPEAHFSDLFKKWAGEIKKPK